MPSDTEADVSARNIKKVNLFVKPNEQRQSREDLSDAMARKGRMKFNVIYTPSGALRRTLKSALSAGSLKFQLIKPDEQQEEGGEA